MKLFWWFRWKSIATAAGLARSVGGETRIPRMRDVEVTPSLVTFKLRLAPGQVCSDIDAMRLASAFGVGLVVVTADANRADMAVCRVVIDNPVTSASALRAPPWPTERSILDPIAIGLSVDQQITDIRFSVRQATSVLVSGIPGSGKSALADLIIGQVALSRDASLVVLDPQNVMLDRWGWRCWLAAGNDVVEAMDVLEAVRDVIATRVAGMSASRSAVEPTQSEPMVVVVLDEWPEYVADGGVEAKRFSALLTSILRTGRKAGVVCVLLSQSADGVTLGGTGARNLIPQRVALKQMTSQASDMVLGSSASHSADASKLPGDVPGLGYVSLNQHAVPELFRGFYQTPEESMLIRRQLLPQGEKSQGCWSCP